MGCDRHDEVRKTLSRSRSRASRGFKQYWAEDDMSVLRRIAGGRRVSGHMLDMSDCRANRSPNKG
jgi:hypothetical protein